MATIWDADVLIWGGLADRRGARSRPVHLALLPLHALPAPHRDRTRYRQPRISAPARRAHAPAVDRNPHHYSPRRTLAPAAVLLDQRVGGTGHPRGPCRGDGVRTPRMVLSGRPRSPARPDHRPRLLRPHRRHRALALPRRPANTRDARRKAGASISVICTPRALPPPGSQTSRWTSGGSSHASRSLVIGWTSSACSTRPASSASSSSCARIHRPSLWISRARARRPIGTSGAALSGLRAHDHRDFGRKP